MVTDPIADFLTRIRNANQVYREWVEIPASKMKQSLAEIMKNEGYIKTLRIHQGWETGNFAPLYEVWPQ